MTNPQLFASIRKRKSDPSRFAMPLDDNTLSLASPNAFVSASVGGISASEPPSATFIVTDSTIRDYDGDIVEASGIDITNWEANGAIWSFGHFDHKFPIGSSIHPTTGQLHWSADNQKAIATCFFDEGSGFAMEVYRLCSKNLLRGASVAFVPGIASQIDKADRFRQQQQGSGWHFQSNTTLTEIAICPIGANSRSLLQSCSGPVMKSLMRKCIGPHCNPTVESIIAKDITQGDLDVPGIQGRNPNPPGDAGQEGEEEDEVVKDDVFDPNLDEIIDRWGDEEPDGDELLDTYRQTGAGVDPNHGVGRGTNSKELGDNTLSPVHLAALTSHAKAEAAFIDDLSDEHKEAIGTEYISKLTARVKDLEDMFASAHPGEDLDDHVAKFEQAYDGKSFTQDVDSEGVDGPAATGENLLIDQGDVPDEAKDALNESDVAGDDEPVEDFDEDKDDVQDMNDARQQVVPKSWADSPADPAVADALDRFERFIAMNKIGGPGGGNGSGISANEMFGRDPSNL